MTSTIKSILLAFMVIVVTIVISKEFFIPAFVNYQYGLYDSPDFEIKETNTNGVGLFTKRQRKKNEYLFVAISADKKITPIGSKINHCPDADADASSVSKINACLLKTPSKDTGEWWIIASRDLETGEELRVDYMNAPDFVHKPDPLWKC
jgi:hypothetical protein